MIMLFGLIIGLLTLWLPYLFWPRTVPRFASQDFIQKYPDKRRIYYLHFTLPIVWLFLYITVIVPILLAIGDDYLYLVSFGLGGGLAIGHGIIEILAGVSMRNFSRGGSATYLVDDSIKRLGWMRVGIVFLLGLIPLSIINLFS